MKLKLLSRIGLWLARRVPRGYWRITRFVARRDPVLWNLPLPLRFIPGKVITADLRESIFVPFLRGGCFLSQVGEDQLFMRLLRPGDVVYDVGANIGYTSMLFSYAVAPNGWVKAFEPAPRAFRFLFHEAKGDSRIQCVNIALSDAAGSLAFYETENLATSSLGPVPGVDPIQVPVHTLDRIAEGGLRPTFVKIDVEGHEPAVFRGMVGTLAGAHPPTVVFEALSSDALTTVLETLRPLVRVVPFHVYRISRSGGLLRTTDPTGGNNYLAIPINQVWRIDGETLPEPLVLTPA